MKNKIKLIIPCTIAILITAILSFIIIFSLKTEEKYIGKLESSYETQRYTSCPEFSVENQITMSSGGYADLYRPVISGGQEVYCIEPGKHLGYSKITKEEIFNYAKWNAYEDDGCAIDCPYIGKTSKTYFSCKGKHYTESSSYFNSNRGIYCSNLYDVGYILSYHISAQNAEDEWAGGKQQAIWMSPICELEDPNRGSHRGSGLQLRKESLEYQEFYQKVVANNNKMVIKDETNKEEVKIDTDQTKKTHKMGPFKINYINGNYPSHAFGGISDMYLLDENGKKIEITKLVRPQNMAYLQPTTVYTPYKEPSYFSNYDEAFNITNVNYVDYFAFNKNYPAPNEEFYVEFNYAGDVTSSLKLHVEFKHLVCNAEICLRTGDRWKISDQGEEDNPYCPGHTRKAKDEDGNVILDENGNVKMEFYNCTGCKHNCYKWAKDPVNIGAQDCVYVLPNSTRRFVSEVLEIEIKGLATTKMKLGGYVFEDLPAGKESLADGVFDDTQDIRLENIEVTLIDASTNQPAKLATLKEENPNATQEEINDKNDYMRRINPTFTDKNGYYEFRGVNTEGKYYIKFTYNGQTYMATDYLKGTGYTNVADMVKNGKYESVSINEPWRYTSKGTEDSTERTNYNNRFASIGSSPLNYVSSNSLGILELQNGAYYNETFSIYELSGITLGSDGKYVHDSQKQLIDTYLEVQSDGSVIDTSDPKYGKTPNLKEGLITKTKKGYIDVYRKYPDNMKGQIYNQIATDEETWKKLQFIEDCKISSYTKPVNAAASKTNSDGYDKYPVYEKFTTFVQSGNQYPNNSYSDLSNYKTYSDTASTYASNTVSANYGTIKEEYTNVYKGQLWINQGLWRRQEADVALRKDVYKATLTVNGKTEVYEYNTRNYLTEAEKQELKDLRKAYEENRIRPEYYNAYVNKKEEFENRYWEIQGRMIDYGDYYSQGYNRELYQSDYHFPGSSTGDDQLKAYITYKITIRNESLSILTRIDEIVDYYDKNYEFQPDKSWAMWKSSKEAGDAMLDDDNTTGNDDVSIPDQDFYDIMTGDLKVEGINDKYRTLNYEQTERASEANYAEEFKSAGYDTLYINTFKDENTGEIKKLQSGEEMYLYLTFKVKGKGGQNGGDLAVETKTEAGKQNIAEINGYSIFYKKDTELPNTPTIDNENTPAGLIDQDSNPGNFTVKDLTKTNDRYEQNFEDDTDRARGMRVFAESEMNRKISGTVWEDKRDTEIEDAVIGNGIREDGEKGIDNVQVELLEVILNENGEAEIDRTTGDVKTKLAQVYSEGKYIDARKMTKDGGKYEFSGLVPGDYIVRFTYGGETAGITTKYNGQDYKSTSYQVGIDQNGRTDVARVNQSTDENRDYKNDKKGYYGYTDTGDYDNNYGQNASGTYGYDIYKVDTSGINYSDAKDIWRVRKQVNDYSSNGVVHDKAELLNNNNQGHKETEMIAETGVIRAEFEYNRQNTKANTTIGVDGKVNKVSNEGYNGTNTGRPSYKYSEDDSNTYNGSYHIKDVDLGLEERPKAQLELNKKVSNVKIVLANQKVLFDSKAKTENLIWIPKTLYNIQSERTEEGNKIYQYYDTDNNDKSYTYNNFRNYIIAKRISNSVLGRQGFSNGLIEATMVDEIMHGATIQITYYMTVTNVGEVDYKETQFYYKGITEGVKDKNSIVKTSADVVLDYVSNNLQFRRASNDSTWEVISKNAAKAIYELEFEGANTAQVLKKYNAILQTTGLCESLIPAKTASNDSTKITNLSDCSTETQLVLSQLITSQNADDDKCYDNVSEIVQISNDVGRRMAYSIQGNQNPDVEKIRDGSAKMEADSSIAEEIKILPPFGIGDIVIYIALAIAVLTILIVGIIFIKKKVLK